MQKNRKLVILGDSAFAEVAHEYFSHDSNYTVVGFAVEQSYLKKTDMFGLPIVAFEEIEKHFPPIEHEIYAALVYTQLNRLRMRLSQSAKAKGYRLASYVSSRANIWPNAQIGEHSFIFEDNTIQPFVKIGNNTVLWSGNHIGHHSTIGDNVFISSHVVISGFVAVGKNAFLGVNSTIANNVVIADDCWIGPGALITKDTKPAEIYRIESTEPAKVDALRYFKIPKSSA